MIGAAITFPLAPRGSVAKAHAAIDRGVVKVSLPRAPRAMARVSAATLED